MRVLDKSFSCSRVSNCPSPSLPRLSSGRLPFFLFFSAFYCLSYLELVLLVFGALVKGPVVSEPPDVIELVETFDVVRHSVSLQHILALRDWRDGIDLQV